MSTEPKQVLIWRHDLRTHGGQKCRTGKIVAQLAHASMAVILNLMYDVRNKDVQIDDPGHVSILPIYKYPAIQQWIEGRFTKICVYVNSEQELFDVYQKAKDMDIPCALITDAGLTEFGGVPTNTCAAVGPWDAEQIDKITGHLNLL
jgi:PTH2 family peptidyl-tRNA hydrolase